MMGKRFPEFDELIRVRSLEISGKISTGILSPGTNYAAYLVYKPTEKPYGFENQTVEVSVGLVGTEKQKRSVYLDAVSPSKRDQLGMFHSFVDHGLSLEFPASWARADYGHHPSLVYRTRRVKRQASLAKEDDGHHHKKRVDDWRKVKLGDFYNAGDENGELEMRVEARSGDWMGGLIVQGIEIRPK
ncbi:F-box protein PP2-B1-like [Mangifera indica]|uniref:F-box protein PP2-B1-like n=1 Tax=Mangifera indica TaxID=29780 RepID=UPI001CFAA2EE|nr:F-box protein PP2-B1-like [Mangifera indica]